MASELHLHSQGEGISVYTCIITCLCKMTSHLQVTFELKQEQCVGINLSVFTIILHGLGSFTFDVNDTHIENGAATFTLPLNGSDPMMDVCTLRGMVYGGNDVGNSEPALILLPDGNQANSIYQYISLHVCLLCSQTVQV